MKISKIRNGSIFSITYKLRVTAARKQIGANFEESDNYRQKIVFDIKVKLTKMDIDTAYIEPLHNHWLEHIRKENEKRKKFIREKNEFFMPFVATSMPVVKTIFAIAENLGLTSNAKYLTVSLYDQFMYNHFSEVYRTEYENGLLSEETWTQICKKISSQAKLRLMSCMQLASKMDSHSKGLGISQVLCVLQRIDKDHEYTRNTIFSSEFKVFKTVGFKIPAILTPLHCIQILVATTGLRHTPGIFDTVISVLDAAYLQHNELYSHIQLMTLGRYMKSEGDKQNFLEMETDTLYLASSVVLCSLFFLSLDKKLAKHMAVKLSDLVNIPSNDILNMANLLFTMTMQDTDPL
ncbi:cyclin N-terminal domain-containing protein 1 [Cephus cinctus]|uniref:Cyclin N-terminal domain-containing protein 1 n=1 Tax=Cephus cinctus TaxID=211228 RepID=A0AAJ7C449_CEPCN|nr:cyclin N-terminal domain-containing protein 1 [Cephus cinctus]